MKKEYKTIKPEDFNIFKRLDGNRKVILSLNKNNLVTKRLELFDSLKTFEQISDVLCCWHTFSSEEKILVILDGQHRKAACEILNIPIDVKIFSQEDGSPLTDEQISEIVKTANNSSKPWTNLQHLEWDAIFNGNPWSKQYLFYRQFYKSLDDGALYFIVTGGNYFGAKRAIQTNTLNFDLSESNLGKLKTKLDFINDCSKTLIRNRRSLQLRGLRKVTINLALEELYCLGYTNTSEIISLLCRWDIIHSINVYSHQDCLTSLLTFLKK